MHDFYHFLKNMLHKYLQPNVPYPAMSSKTLTNCKRNASLLLRLLMFSCFLSTASLI